MKAFIYPSLSIDKPDDEKEALEIQAEYRDAADACHQLRWRAFTLRQEAELFVSLHEGLEDLRKRRGSYEVTRLDIESEVCRIRSVWAHVHEVSTTLALNEQLTRMNELAELARLVHGAGITEDEES